MKSDDDDVENLLDEFLRRQWPRIRARGRANWVWKQNVLAQGMPISLFSTIGIFYALEWPLADVLTLRGSGLIYIVFVFMNVSFYRYASKEWLKQEARYLKTHPQDDLHL